MYSRDLLQSKIAILNFIFLGYEVITKKLRDTLKKVNNTNRNTRLKKKENIVIKRIEQHNT